MRQVSKIPASAVWLGGRNSGSWIDLVESIEERRFHLRIYIDETGELETDAWFRLSDNCRDQRITEKRFQEVVRSYDGKRLTLSPDDGRQHCFLTPIVGIDKNVTRIFFRINQRRVSEEQFQALKHRLVLSGTFSEGELMRPGQPGTKIREHGFVHIWSAEEMGTRRKYQYSVEAFDEETIYSIQAVNK